MILVLGAHLAEKILSNFSNYAEELGPKALSFLIKIIVALIVFLIGKKLVKLVTKIIEKGFTKSRVDASVSMFLTKFFGSALYLLLIIIIVTTILGLESGSLVALVGSAGIAVGLALQGSLSNFAGGVLILILKPFRLGDYIVALSNEGTVTGLDIFYTTLTTIDNRIIIMPNGTLSNSNIINVTSEKLRRLDLLINVGYSENIQRVRDVLMMLAKNHELVLQENEIMVFVNSLEASNISMGLRVWCDKDNYWPLRSDLLEKIKNAFDEHHIIIPYKQFDITLKQ